MLQHALLSLKYFNSIVFTFIATGSWEIVGFLIALSLSRPSLFFCDLLSNSISCRATESSCFIISFCLREVLSPVEDVQDCHFLHSAHLYSRNSQFVFLFFFPILAMFILIRSLSKTFAIPVSRNISFNSTVKYRLNFSPRLPFSLTRYFSPKNCYISIHCSRVKQLAIFRREYRSQ